MPSFQPGGYAARALALARAPRPDLWWVEKELWPYAPAALERALLSGRPYALDFDDAIFHNYDLHPRALVRRLWGHKIDRLMAEEEQAGIERDYERAAEKKAQRIYQNEDEPAKNIHVAYTEE